MRLHFFISAVITNSKLDYSFISLWNKRNGKRTAGRLFIEKKLSKKKRNTVSRNNCEILKGHWLFEVC